MASLFRICLSSFILILCAVLFNACSSSARVSSEGSSILPSPDVSLSPSSFRCRVKVLSADSGRVSLFISEVLQRGSSLIYAVSAGDTLEARFLSQNEKSPTANSFMEALMEERLKLNSDKPDFVIRQIKTITKK